MVIPPGCLSSAWQTSDPMLAGSEPNVRPAPLADIGPTSPGALCRFAGIRSASPGGAALMEPGHDRLAGAETFATWADRKAQAVLHRSDDGAA